MFLIMKYMKAYRFLFLILRLFLERVGLLFKVFKLNRLLKDQYGDNEYRRILLLLFIGLKGCNLSLNFVEC